MTLEQFRQLAGTWGGNIDRWPAAMQDAARELAADEQAAGILDEQLRLDRLFSLAPKVDECRGLRPSSLFPATSLVCSALVGLWLAGSLPYRQGPPDAVAVVSMVFDSSTLSLGGLQ
jgi:hypothetical protein